MFWVANRLQLHQNWNIIPTCANEWKPVRAREGNIGRFKEGKRRGNNAGSVYLYRGRYVLMYIDPVSGKRKKKTLTAKADKGVDQAITEKSIAEKAAAEFLAGIPKITAIESKAELMVKVAEAKKIINRTRLSLSDIWTAFESSPERPDSGPGTLKKYKIFCDRFIAWLKKNRRAEDASWIDADTAAAFMAYLWGTGIFEATYNSYRQALQLIFRIVLKEDGMENPFARISKKSENPQSHQDFTAEEVNRIFQQLAPASGYRMLHCIRSFARHCSKPKPGIAKAVTSFLKSPNVIGRIPPESVRISAN